MCHFPHIKSKHQTVQASSNNIQFCVLPLSCVQVVPAWKSNRSGGCFVNMVSHIHGLLYSLCAKGHSDVREQRSTQRRRYWQIRNVLFPSNYSSIINTVDTFGNCQRPVLSFGVTNTICMHKITNSQLQENNAKEKTALYKSVCFQMHKRLQLKYYVTCVRIHPLSNVFILSTALRCSLCFQVSFYANNYFE